MNKLLLTFCLLLGSLVSFGQFQKVKTFKEDVRVLRDIQRNSYLVETDKSNEEITFYSASSFTAILTIPLHIPSGYSFDSLYLFSPYLHTTAGMDLFYTVKNSSGASQGILLDEQGNVIRTFSDAVSIKRLYYNGGFKMAVTKLKSGVYSSEVWGIFRRFGLEHTYSTGNLKFSNFNTVNDIDSGNMYFYYLDVPAKKINVYWMDHSFSYSFSVNVPSGHTLLDQVQGFPSLFLNTNGYFEFAIFLENSGKRSAKIINDRAELASFNDAVEFDAHTTNRINMLGVAIEKGGNTTWEYYEADNSASNYSVKFWNSFGERFSFNGLQELGFAIDTDSMISRLYGYKFTEYNKGKIDLDLAKTDKVISWSRYYNGLIDGNNQNEEILVLSKSSSNKYNFKVRRNDNTTLLSVNNARRLEVFGNFSTPSTSLFTLLVPGQGVEVYVYDFSLSQANRISPANQAEQLDFKTATFNWNSVKNANNYELLIWKDDTTAGNWQYNTSDTFYTLQNFLDSASTYYWKVTARNSILYESNKGSFRFKTFDAGAIDAPILLSPTSTAKDVEIPVSLSWEKVDDADSYEYMYSTGPDFSISTTGSVNTTMTTVSGLAFNTTYFWRVRAKRGAGFSKWSDAWFFETQDEPTVAAPSLISPANEATNVSVAPKLTWGTVTNATRYHYEYAATTDFINPKTGSTTDTEVGLNGLNNEQTYYWRVRAEESGEFSVWSKVWYFETQKAADIGAPTLVSPANMATDITTKPKLEWELVVDATGYQYEYATSSDFATSSTGSVNTVETQLGDLETNTTYYWRVRAEKLGQYGAWSSIWAFTTSEEEALEAPVLLSPANYSESINPESVVLEWQAVNEAETYDVQLSTFLNFQTFSTGTPTGTTITFNDLQESTTYYWRVKSIASPNESDWSELFTFTTDQLESIDGSLPSPLVSIYPNPLHDQLFIELDTRQEQQATLLQVVDLNGSVLYENPNWQGSGSIDLGELDKGVYFLKLEQVNQSIMRRIVKL